MVGHQHIGIDPARALVLGLSQAFQVKVVVLIVEEDRLAIVSALDDVMRKGRDRDATGARHDRVPQRSRFPTVLAGLPGVKKIVL